MIPSIPYVRESLKNEVASYDRKYAWQSIYMQVHSQEVRYSLDVSSKK